MARDITEQDLDKMVDRVLGDVRMPVDPMMQGQMAQHPLLDKLRRAAQGMRGLPVKGPEPKV